MNVAEMQQYAVPVDGQHLGWAKSAYQAAGVPIVQIVPIGGGQYAIVIMAPAGGAPPDWRNLRTYRRPPFWRRIDVGRWLPWLIVLAVVAAAGWVLINGLPLAVAEVLPEWAPPLPTIAPPVIIEGPDLSGITQPVEDARDKIATGIMAIGAFVFGLLVLYFGVLFRGTIAAVVKGLVDLVRRDQ